MKENHVRGEVDGGDAEGAGRGEGETEVAPGKIRLIPSGIKVRLHWIKANAKSDIV